MRKRAAFLIVALAVMAVYCQAAHAWATGSWLWWIIWRGGW
jgi:hypothetical protein